MQCQDSIKDHVGPNTSEDQMDKYKAQYEKCVFKCVDTHVDMIPNMIKKMKEIVKSGKYTNNML